MAGQTQGGSSSMAGGPPSYTPPPKDGFPGFPDAERVKPKAVVQGGGFLMVISLSGMGSIENLNAIIQEAST